MKILLNIVTYCLVILCLTGCMGPSIKEKERAQLHQTLGVRLLSQEKYPEALNELLIAHSLDPDDPYIDNNLALAYFVRGKYAESEKLLRSAIENKPEFTEARNNLGRTLLKLNLNKEAVFQLKIAVEDLTFPQPEKSYSNYGIALFQLKKYKEALDALSHSLRIRSTHCETLLFYGKTLYELKHFKKSAQSLDQINDNCTKDILEESLYYSGLSYFQDQQKLQAIARLEEAIKLNQSTETHTKAEKILQLIKKKNQTTKE